MMNVNVRAIILTDNIVVNCTKLEMKMYFSSALDVTLF